MFYDQLNELCIKEKITPTKFVTEILHLSSSKVTAWKNGSIPKYEILDLIAKHFDVTIGYLFDGKEKNSIQDNLSEDEKRLLNMYSLLTDIEKGEILGELKTITKGRGEWELIPMIIIWYVLYLFEMIKVIENFF